jgi:hypothetical protein
LHKPDILILQRQPEGVYCCVLPYMLASDARA